MSTEATPATFDAALTLDSRCEIGSDEVGPYRKVFTSLKCWHSSMTNSHVVQMQRVLTRSAIL